MKILHTVAELHAWRVQHDQVSFVPTMGNLHEGHLALIKLAQQHAPTVIVSIFVNPLQFGAGEDYTRYPRTLEADAAKLSAIGIDAIFAPSVEELYPQPQRYFITPPALANTLCGAYRPGHFEGVATVVMKLFQLVQPTIAVFGKKDYQQLTIIRGMVEDFAVPITIIAGETIRATDGLALSSRNGFLSPTERALAPALYQQLTRIQQALQDGERDYAQLQLNASNALIKQGWQVDYIAICDTQLNPANLETSSWMILGAARLETTRLIDNVMATS
ncbi:pantoate--beta-alanine ligase [Sulfuriferula nivalis]|uniref:Pantothenate synthetase n=1 Tax=Sulfuriferula nivalis TaxID=2675298 RepID=A0A809RHA1_9PROT|nr:pantoate--beta-alanine ligase [Sulfuriferula nivalis]BBP01259.1 pantothenate synthetase [Sulfuriferula nivalis]